MHLRAFCMLTLGLLITAVQARVIATGPVNTIGPAISDLNHVVPNVSSTPLSFQKRQCVKQSDGEIVCDFLWPTMSEMLYRLNDASDGVKVSPDIHHYFYTNNRKPTPEERGKDETTYDIQVRWAAGWMAAMNLPAINWRQGVSEDWWKTQNEWVIANWELMDTGSDPGMLNPGSNLQPKQGADAGVIFTFCLLQAYCRATLNPEVYLFTQKGDFKPNQVWADVEFWVLTQNPAVQKIWRVDPAPGCHQGEADKEVLWDRARGDPEGTPKWICPVNDNSP
ncbi:uncharacterized protein AB675_9834 [Cyphellophora attinorum]|uniref:Uncharacterized protein n=1 Tax=Cyphellophora attinorum TaxID=1664694 RepID=A0A0N0NP67_9EURO|nr:uncharacterized protein AB675_9834 [Phialophora attinorum]KPI42368.1 hypothetical protein AB675_9834 [Phialophora attinorum]